jgi:uncharacterized protein YecA (UPF0149 family)
MRNRQAQQCIMGHIFPIFERRQVSKAMEQAEYDTSFSKSPARNAPCPCGSGQKWKYCILGSHQPDVLISQ